MRWLFPLLLFTAGMLAAGVLTACRDRGPRMAPYMPEPASPSSADGADGGDPMHRDGGGPATAPTIQPQPGDIQI